MVSAETALWSFGGVVVVVWSFGSIVVAIQSCGGVVLCGLILRRYCLFGWHLWGSIITSFGFDHDVFGVQSMTSLRFHHDIFTVPSWCLEFAVQLAAHRQHNTWLHVVH
jgi:hypothetical protein